MASKLRVTRQEKELLKLLEAGEPPVSERARIILAAAAGQSDAEIAARLFCPAASVARWRAAFVAHGIAGLAAERVRVSESPAALLEEWKQALADLAHDRAILERVGLLPDLLRAVGVLPEAKRRELVTCRILDLGDVIAANQLLEAAREADDVSAFAGDVERLGEAAELPGEAEHLLELVRGATPPQTPPRASGPRDLRRPAEEAGSPLGPQFGERPYPAPAPDDDED